MAVRILARVVDVEGVVRDINLGLLTDDPAVPGDWILIHMGMAMEKVDAQAAADARSGLELLGRDPNFLRTSNFKFSVRISRTRVDLPGR